MESLRKIMPRGKFRAALPLVFLWGIFAALYISSAFERAEDYLYDKIYQRVSPADSRIAVIGIDDTSVARLGQWPWSRKLMAAVIDKLTDGGAAAVCIDVLFDTPGVREPGEDESLAAALRRADNVVLPVYGMFRTRTAERMNADELVMPAAVFRSNYPAHVNALTESGGVMRRGLLDIFYDGARYGSMAYEAAKIYKGADFRDEIPRDAAGRYYVKFTGRSGWYHPISFADVLEGKAAPEYFKGKIVLIGLYAQGIAKDWQFTSIDGGRPTYGVEIHANMVQQFLEGDYLKDLPAPAVWVFFVLFSAAAAAAFMRCKPRVRFYVLAALLAVSGALTYMTAKAGFVAPVLYTPSFCCAAYVMTLAWHEVRIRTTFGRYMAPSVIKKILSEGEEGLQLRGTLRTVTVMFVDIRGFTSLSESVSPEDVVKILNEYFDLVAACVHRNNGTLDKFIGDAAMAVWGAPYDRENHAGEAVQAAIELRGESEALSRKLAAMYGREVGFGIGINSGEAVIGNIGAEKLRMDYTAIGDTVNTAARLESVASRGQILISKATYERLADKDKAEFLEMRTLKGKSEAIPVYEVSGR